MPPAPFELIADLLADPANGWSIGSFGAVGEFVRDADEPAEIRRTDTVMEIATARGAIRLDAASLPAVAWDSLSSDGETWGHALAFCAAHVSNGDRTVRPLGPDHDAIRNADRTAMLFDLGVASGCVKMCARTADPDLIAALDAATGQPLLTVPGIMAVVLKAQPHRVILSPAGRIEVFQPIPAADGTSPEGPHTHLLPKLIAKDRPHSANVPIPEGWQSVLSMHPPSPWRTMLGERHPYDAATDAAFAPLLDRFGLESDKAVAASIRASLDGDLDWPEGRRARHVARITLRRLAAAGDARTKAWRAVHDRAPLEIEEGEEA